MTGSTATGYRRDAFTRAAFGLLLAFGFLNAVLGPALPYLRAAEGISYLVGSLHQAAFSVGGGLAGYLAARAGERPGRALTIRVGLAGAAVAAIALGYAGRAGTVAVTIAAAFLVSLLASSALIRIWAALADAHREFRTVAMTEGEVAVSVGGIVAPLLLGVLAASPLGWRFGFVAGAAVVVAAVLASLAAPVPPVRGRPDGADGSADDPSYRPRLRPTLVIVFAIVALEFTVSFWVASYLADDVGLVRDLAAGTVAVLYAANLVGRLLVSRLARRARPETLLAAALALTLAGLPVLLLATGPAAAVPGLVVAGTGIGALFPLVSSLHVAATPRSADHAVGEVLTVASAGQVTGPVVAGAVAQAAGLRVGLLVTPLLVLLAAAALARHAYRLRPSDRSL